MSRPLLALIATALVVVAGCGGGEAPSNPLAALDLAVDRTKDVESMRQTISMKADFGGQRLSLEGEATGTADAENGAMTMTMDVAGESLEFEGLIVDDAIYMRSDDIPLPKGKEWMRTQDVPASSLDPAEFVQHLRESQGAENLGTKEIRGEHTTHFGGPVDINRLFEASYGEDMAEQLRQLPNIEQFKMAIDVWVLEDGLPARVTMKLTAPESVEGSMTMSSDFLQYDVPVDVEAPPASKVIDESKVPGMSSA